MSNVAAAELKEAQDKIITSGTTYYLSLHTGEPKGTGEHEGTDGRQVIKFGEATSAIPSVQESTDEQVWSSVAGGQTYKYFGIWTASTSGTYKRGGALTSEITPPAGAEVVFATGAVTLKAE